MRAAGDDPAAVEHEDLVRPADGAEPVGDHEGGAALHQLVESRLDHALGLRVDAGGGVVEDEDARILQKGPGDRDRCFWPPERVAPRSPTRVS